MGRAIAGDEIFGPTGSARQTSTRGLDAGRPVPCGKARQNRGSHLQDHQRGDRLTSFLTRTMTDKCRCAGRSIHPRPVRDLHPKGTENSENSPDRDPQNAEPKKRPVEGALRAPPVLLERTTPMVSTDSEPKGKKILHDALVQPSPTVSTSLPRRHGKDGQRDQFIGAHASGVLLGNICDIAELTLARKEDHHL